VAKLTPHLLARLVDVVSLHFFRPPLYLAGERSMFVAVRPPQRHSQHGLVGSSCQRVIQFGVVRPIPWFLQCRVAIYSHTPTHTLIYYDRSPRPMCSEHAQRAGLKTFNCVVFSCDHTARRDSTKRFSRVESRGAIAALSARARGTIMG
jgi:hypothetical protein